MFEWLIELVVLMPLAIIFAAVLAMAGFAAAGAWGGGGGAVVGLALGFFLDIWLGSRVDAIVVRRKWAGRLLVTALLVAVALIAIWTR